MRTLEKKIIKYIRETGGNFGMMTAILLPVLIGVSGMAYDLTRAVQLKSDMQGLADSAVLSAASALVDKEKSITHEEAKRMAGNFYAAQISQYQQFYTSSRCDIDSSPENLRQSVNTQIREEANGAQGKKFEVTVSIPYEMCVNPLTAILTGKKVPLSVEASTTSSTESKNGFSMYLVLDKSSSMDEKTCLIRKANGTCKQRSEMTKMAALKIAANDLLNVITEADARQQYTRLAAVSYNGGMARPEGLNWGAEHIRSYINALNPSGGTNSSAATATAFSALAATGSDSELNKHREKHEGVVTKYILLMTDGDNNSRSSDTSTLATCAQAKQQNIVVYSVAFEAPNRGKEMLLACATSAGHYYDADNAASLSSAFKDIGLRALAASARLTN